MKQATQTDPANTWDSAGLLYRAFKYLLNNNRWAIWGLSAVMVSIPLYAYSFFKIYLTKEILAEFKQTGFFSTSLFYTWLDDVLFGEGNNIGNIFSFTFLWEIFAILVIGSIAGYFCYINIKRYVRRHKNQFFNVWNHILCVVSIILPLSAIFLGSWPLIISAFSTNYWSDDPTYTNYENFFPYRKVGFLLILYEIIKFITLPILMLVLLAFADELGLAPLDAMQGGLVQGAI